MQSFRWDHLALSGPILLILLVVTKLQTECRVLRGQKNGNRKLFRGSQDLCVLQSCSSRSDIRGYLGSEVNWLMGYTVAVLSTLASDMWRYSW